MISANEKRVYKNTLVLTLRTLLTIPIGFLSVRVAFNLLGASDYGLANVLGSLVSLAMILSRSVAGAARRFLCYDLADYNPDRTRRLFSMLLMVYWITSVGLVLLLEVFGYWMITQKISMPASSISIALLYYQTIVLGFVFQYIGGAYSTVLVAQEEMSAIAWVSLGESIVHLCLMAVLCFWGDINMIIPYGMACMLSFGLSYLSYYLIAKYKFSEVVSFKYNWDGKVFKRLLSFTAWQLCGGVVSSLYVIIKNVIINNFFTSIFNAAQGIADLVNGKIGGFGMGFMDASQPQLIKLYAQGEINQLECLFLRITKYSFFILLLIGFPFFVNIESILSVWLKEPPPYCALFTVLGFLTALVDVTCVPGNTIIEATGCIRGKQICGCTIPWFFLGLIYLGVLYGVGIVLIPTVAFVAAVVGNLVRFIFIKRLIPSFRVWHFFIGVFKGVLPVLCGLGIIGYGIRYLMPHNTWVSTVGSSGLAAIFGAAVIFFLGLSVDERNLFIAFIKRKFSAFCYKRSNV